MFHYQHYRRRLTGLHVLQRGTVHRGKFNQQSIRRRTPSISKQEHVSNGEKCPSSVNRISGVTVERTAFKHCA